MDGAFLSLLSLFLFQLAAFQLIDILRPLIQWYFPIHPETDSCLRQILRKMALDIAVAAFLSYGSLAIIIATVDSIVRPAGRLR